MKRFIKYIKLTIFRVVFISLFLGFGYIITNAVHLQKPSSNVTPVSGLTGERVLLQRGGEADLVSGVQRELTSLGYMPGTVNGVLGPQTEAAIIAWQFDNRTTVTGEVTSELLKQLIFGAVNGGKSSPQAQKAQTKTVIKLTRSVEQVLADFGYQPGPVDGIADRETEAAIKAFEKDRDLEVTGRISGRLLAEIKHISSASLR